MSSFAELLEFKISFSATLFKSSSTEWIAVSTGIWIWLLWLQGKLWLMMHPCSYCGHKCTLQKHTFSDWIENILCCACRKQCVEAISSRAGQCQTFSSGLIVFCCQCCYLTQRFCSQICTPAVAGNERKDACCLYPLLIVHYVVRWLLSLM